MTKDKEALAKDKEVFTRNEVIEKKETKPTKIYYKANKRRLRLVFKPPSTKTGADGRPVFQEANDAQFNDYNLVVLDVPENKRFIEDLERHPSFGVKFWRVPDFGETETLEEQINRYNKMDISEIRKLCDEKSVRHNPAETQQELILKLLPIINKSK